MARPASASCSIEVLKAPSLRVTAWRSSGLWVTSQPISRPMAAASPMAAEQNWRTSSSSSRRSMVAPVIAETGFMVRLPHSLYQMS
ncbi:hypothetical protein D3C78_1125710 [compost metagenome]